MLAASWWAFQVPAPLTYMTDIVERSVHVTECLWGARLSDDVQQQVNTTFRQHQALIRGHRDRLEELRLGEPAYTASFDAMVAATHELLAYERQIPVILAGPERARSQKIVTWTVNIQLALTAAAALTVIPGWTTWPWLILLVLHAAAVLTLFGTVSDTRHGDQRFAAIVLNIAAAADAVVIYHLVSGWWTVLPALATIGMLAFASDAKTPAGGSA